MKAIGSCEGHGGFGPRNANEWRRFLSACLCAETGLMSYLDNYWRQHPDPEWPVQPPPVLPGPEEPVPQPPRPELPPTGPPEPGFPEPDPDPLPTFAMLRDLIARFGERPTTCLNLRRCDRKKARAI